MLNLQPLELLSTVNGWSPQRRLIEHDDLTEWSAQHDAEHPATLTTELYFADSQSFATVDLFYDTEHDVMVPVQEYQGDIKDAVIEDSALENVLSTE